MAKMMTKYWQRGGVLAFITAACLGLVALPASAVAADGTQRVADSTQQDCDANPDSSRARNACANSQQEQRKRQRQLARNRADNQRSAGTDRSPTSQRARSRSRAQNSRARSRTQNHRQASDGSRSRSRSERAPARSRTAAADQSQRSRARNQDHGRARQQAGDTGRRSRSDSARDSGASGQSDSVGAACGLAGGSSPSSRQDTQASHLAGQVPRGNEYIAPVDSRMEREMLEEVNAERRAQGLSSLEWDDGLADVARFHAAHMDANGYFSHTTQVPGSNGQMQEVMSFGERASAFGVGASAENLAMGYQTAQAANTGLMNSDGHRRNILSTSPTRLGVGYYNGHWVQKFGW